MLFKWNLQPDYFNPRSHEGSDTLEKYIYATGTDFNPRSHEGSDLVKSVCVAGMNYFNPRSHEGSDTGEPTTRSRA